MERNKKHQIVNKLREEMKDIDSVFLVNFKGITVEKDTEVRRKLRETGSNYEVVKNTLLKLAFEGTDFSQLNEHLVGNTAIAHTQEDLIGLAKAIKDFNKEIPAFSFKAGVVQGKVIDLQGLETLASLPSKEELVSKLMYLLNFPVQGLVNALAGLPRNLVVALDQIKQKKEQESAA